MDMDEASIPKKVIWLASYMKSGNTWFRAFITALLNEGELDINEMKTDGIFSSRQIFDHLTDVDSAELYDEEATNMMSGVYCDLSRSYTRDRLFIKIHDAYTFNSNNAPVVPEAPTICALYFIRNPLDIAASFASHNGTSIDKTIALMNNSTAKSAGTANQLPQLALSWSRHVRSWTDGLPFPVMVLRYEDMLIDTVATFTRAVNFMGMAFKPDQIKTALEACRFEKLQQKEQEKGFSEKNIPNQQFFRKGQAGGWKNELTTAQAQLIIDNHKTVMEKYGYPTSVEEEIQGS
jgi:hypothetical protein